MGVLHQLSTELWTLGHVAVQVCPCMGLLSQAQPAAVSIPASQLTVSSLHTSAAVLLKLATCQLPCRCGLSHSLDDEDVVQVLKSKTAAAEDGA